MQTQSLKDEEARIFADITQRVTSQVERRREAMEDTFKSAEQGFYLMCAEALKGIGDAANTGKLTGGNVIRLKSLVNEVAALNVFGDKGLEEYVAKIGQLVEGRAKGKGKEASMEEIARSLADAGAYIQTQISEIPPMRGARAEAEIGETDAAPDTGKGRRGSGTEEINAGEVETASRRGKRGE